MKPAGITSSGYFLPEPVCWMWGVGIGAPPASRRIAVISTTLGSISKTTTLVTRTENLMDAYFVCSPDSFSDGILSLGGAFDAVVSSHNLEHCDSPVAVLEAMCRSVREGGLLYLAFPSEATVGFPHREGCLSFHDDGSHRHLPKFESVLGTLISRGFRVERQVRRNRGTMRVLWLLGALQEPWSRWRGRVLRGTWYFWGFESVIVARRIQAGQ